MHWASEKLLGNLGLNDTSCDNVEYWESFHERGTLGQNKDQNDTAEVILLLTVPP